MESKKPLWYDNPANKQVIKFVLENSSGYAFDVVCNLEEDVKCLLEDNNKPVSEDIKKRALKYYSTHLNLCQYTGVETIWNQAAPEYQQCFLDLARIEIEDEARMEEAFNGE
ncbi:hypothetical protein VP424E501_P0103 [Vibrio phage 424E50-1]|nr:hypothetical protein VP424E501_P0103 [Vibrio phage 424E50-1]